MRYGSKKLIPTAIMLSTIIISIFAVAIAVDTRTSTEPEEVNLPIFVKIFTDDTIGTIPFEVNFNSLVTNNIGDVKYTWDFGDGSTSNKIKTNHTYLING